MYIYTHIYIYTFWTTGTLFIIIHYTAINTIIINRTALIIETTIYSASFDTATNVPDTYINYNWNNNKIDNYRYYKYYYLLPLCGQLSGGTNLVFLLIIFQLWSSIDIYRTPLHLSHESHNSEQRRNNFKTLLDIFETETLAPTFVPLPLMALSWKAGSNRVGHVLTNVVFFLLFVLVNT